MADGPSIGVLVVAYNAAGTLASVLDRIPTDLRPQIAAVLVSDDHSADGTYELGIDYQQRGDLPLTMIRQPRNLGYGGNQKFGYRWAIDQGVDIVVLLHGDGQYAPERMADLVEPIAAGRADVVLGSRMLEPGRARRGGMPAYKYVGNRILSRVQNAVVGMDLSEWHSGYRAFAVPALAGIPFEANSDDFDFDTEVLLQLHASGARLAEVPIPTYYGDEICYVDGVRYARAVTADVVRYRLGRIGFGPPRPGTEPEGYDWKPAAGSSHERLVSLISARPPGRVLDLGCATGELGRRLTEAGHAVTGVDLHPSAEAKERLAAFVQADLDDGLPPEAAARAPYETVVAADVLEHVRQPGRLLDELVPLVAPGGVLVASVPNFGHWYPRARVAVGRFDYDERGILDRDHVRFFTRRSFTRLAGRHGWRVVAGEATGLPFDVADRGGRPGAGARLQSGLGRLDRVAIHAWPTLFGYQFILTLEPR